MTINSTVLRNSFFVSPQSNIQFSYNKLTDNPSSLEKSFIISSSATAFYIKAVPTVSPADSNIKFFLKKDSILEEVNNQKPLILLPKSSPSSPSIPGEIIVKVVNADLLFDKISNQDANKPVATISYQINFTLTAGVPGVVRSDGGNSIPKIKSFELQSPTKPIGCSPIQMLASWEIDTQNVNTSEYRLQIKETQAEFPLRTTNNTPVNTLETYGDGNLYNIQPSLTLQIIKVSNFQIVESIVATSPAAITSGLVC